MASSSAKEEKEYLTLRGQGSSRPSGRSSEEEEGTRGRKERATTNFSVGRPSLHLRTGKACSGTQAREPKPSPEEATNSRDYVPGRGDTGALSRKPGLASRKRRAEEIPEALEEQESLLEGRGCSPSCLMATSRRGLTGGKSERAASSSERLGEAGALRFMFDNLNFPSLFKYVYFQILLWVG